MLVGEEGKGKGCEEERGGIVRVVTTHRRCWRKDGGQDAVEGNGAAPSSHPLSNVQIYISTLLLLVKAGKASISDYIASVQTHTALARQAFQKMQKHNIFFSFVVL